MNIFARQSTCVLFLMLIMASSVQAGGVLREVWTQLRGSRVSDLESAPIYPHAPVYREVIADFDAPVNWGSYYGSRLRAILTVPETADYTFWISGDDYCELHLSSNQDPRNAQQIAYINGWTPHLTWDKYDSQRSASIRLTKGQKVYIEALHKEHGGGDSVSVGWSTNPEATPVVISGDFLTPFETPPAPSANLLVEAGASRTIYSPALTATLNGQAVAANGDTRYLTAEWSLLLGEPVTFSETDNFTTEVTFPGPGLYRLQLSASNRTDQGSDHVTFVVHRELHPQAGSATQALWFGVDGNDLSALLNHSRFPGYPDAIRPVDQLSGPVNYTSRYGTLTRGYLLPPVDGDYKIFASGDHHVRLRLSTDDSEENLQTMSEHFAGDPEPMAITVRLLKGQRYFFELQFMEKWSRNHHNVFWRMPGDDAFRVISGEFLAPAAITSNDAELNPFSPDAEYLVSAGPDKVVYAPETLTSLDGYLHKRVSKANLILSEWKQTSGPNAVIASPSSEGTSVSLSQMGQYTFEFTAVTENQVVTDEVMVEMKPRLASALGGITRQVWLNRNYSNLEALRADPDFPGFPDLVDNLSSFEGPVDWGSKYGTRVTGHLQVPQSGYYTFYLSADDYAEAFLSTDASSSHLEPLCSVTTATRHRTWTGQDSQRSSPRFLEAGKRYFVELHHLERWSRDHFSLGWTIEGSNDIQVVAGSFLEPSDPNAAAFDIGARYYGNAGRDRRYYWPHDQTRLDGRVMRVYGDDTGYTVHWRQQSGPPSAIKDETTLAPLVEFTGPGTYEYELTVFDGSVEHRDRVAITVSNPINDSTGYLLRSVWLNVSGWRLEDLREADPELANPTFEDWQPGVQTPNGWADYYGTRLAGFLHVPVGGVYTFWTASDDQSELWLGTSANPASKRLIANAPRSVGVGQWERRDGQKSDGLILPAGTYYFEALQKEQTGGDHLAVAWEGPATNGREVISRGFLSPLSAAPLQNPDIQVILGQDQTLLWPDDQLDLVGLVYDLEQGPQPLTYTWSQTAGPALAVVADPNYPITAVTFPQPGIYEIRLAASDGAHSGEDSLIVTVQDPLAPRTGGILREAWVDVSGWQTADLENDPRFPNQPSFSDVLPTFDTPIQWGEQYGQRLSGLITVPETATYQFFIASDDQSDLYLNPNGVDPNGAERIAYAERATGRYRWNRREGQASAPIRLEAGRSYYVEAVHKERTGSDYLSVAWKFAESESSPTVIAGAYLSAASEAALNDGELTLELGETIEAHWPISDLEIKAVALDENPGPEPLSFQWVATSVPPGVSTSQVNFLTPSKAQTVVDFPAPGRYTIQLRVSDGLHSRTDDVPVIIHAPLSNFAGSILAEVYEEISGSWVTNLTSSDKYPEAPDRRYQLDAFELPQNSGDYYGTLIRGYLHPPVSGIYRFNLSSDDWSEVFLSPSDDPDAKELICFVPKATQPYEWQKYPEYQISRPVALEAGKRYYIEARHKEHTSRDHMALAWHVPGTEAYEIIHGAYVSPWQFDDSSAPVVTLSGPSEMTITVGAAYNDPGYSASDDTDGNLSSQVTTMGEVDTATPGVYQVLYKVTDSFGNVSSTVVRKVNVVLEDATPAQYLPDRSSEYLPAIWLPPASLTEAEAARFLMQASFGPSPESVQRLRELGIAEWLAEQFAMSPSLHLEHLDRMTRFRAASSKMVNETKMMEDDMMLGMDMMDMPRVDYRNRLRTWWTHAVTAPDQLRQLTAYALSNIFVISDKSPALKRYPRAVTNYYDILVRHAFGNYRDLLEEVTLSPMMGLYLTMLRSTKESPDENYAREVLQLFSIGLDELNTDGTFKTDTQGETIPTYGQNEILELSRALTGWTYAGSDNFFWTGYRELDVMNSMIPFEEFHDRGSKTLLGGFTTPAGLTAHQDIDAALDNIFNHPNVGPFIARRLIQKLVKSNPSPAYIFRVASAFNNNGAGVRGDLQAVVRAILLDPEARQPSTGASKDGKLREPILRAVHFLRALHQPTNSNPPTLGQVALDDTSRYFAQAALHAPSVFNFFEPDFQMPGALMDAGLYTPEFQITTEVTTVDTTNYFYRGIYRGFDTSSTFSRPQLDKAPLISRSDSSNAVLDYIETYLIGRGLSLESRTALASLFETYGDDREGLVTALLQVIAASPEFAIQN